MMFKFSNPGSRIKPIREAVLKDGSMEVVEVGTEDLQAYIDSFRDSCDVETLVLRATNGDPDALNQRSGSYGDFTVFPKTYAEVLQRVIDAQNLFNTLPLENRAAFSNDVYKFISEMDDPEWPVKAGFMKPQEKEEVREDVKE